MAKESKIAWTNATWNPWQGCKKISCGCENCYMYRDKINYGQDPKDIHRSSAKTFNSPLKWKESKKIFVCSWSDFFLKEADQWRDDAWDIIRRCQQHTFLLLTKRENRIEQGLPPDWGEGYSNCWLGVTAEDQLNLERRTEVLRSIPAKIKFLSIEPLLGPLFMENHLEGIDWAIIAGESGLSSRPFRIEWARSIIEQCKKANVAVFMKQLGAKAFLDSKRYPTCHRNGEDPAEWPEDIRIREFPVGYGLFV